MRSQSSFWFVISTLLCFFSTAQAQSDIPVFTWRSHLSHNSIVDISSTADRIYSAAQNALFYVDRDEFSINKITKNDGLSDVSIGAIHFSETLDVLIIGYVNGNIDLLYESRILNIPTFRDADLIGTKRFHDIKVSEGLIYMASDQGIIVIDPVREEIAESYRNLREDGSRLAVVEMAFTADSIYAATPSGILSASLAPGVNRQDFNNWTRNLTNQSFQNIVNTSAGLVASSADLIYRNDGSTWPNQALSVSETVRDLFESGNELFGLTATRVLRLTENQSSVVATLEDDVEGTTLIHNAQGHWIGTTSSGLLNFNRGTYQNFSPTGPDSDNVWDLFYDSDTIYNLQGGYSTFVEPQERPGAISKFNAGRWSIMATRGAMVTPTDIVDMAFFNNQNYAASFSNGLINLSSGNQVIDETSPGSTLERDNGSLNITSIATEDEVLWVTTYERNNSLHRYDPNSGTWQAFSFSQSQSDFPLDLLVLPNGDKWMALDANRGGGIFVFNEQSNFSRYLNTNGGQGGLPGRQVNAMVLDQNRFLWVGTNAGIAFYPNPSAILDGGAISASLPVFENSFLLRNEFITAVAIDAGNRKWIGSATNGIWLFSESGDELVHHFTAENSPLLSNEITAIEIDPNTGEVFIGTSSGLVSFRSDAIEGEAVHNNVKAFPNPVSRDFNGVVTITGLANGAAVKITDASGKLVREMRAQGSSATWDARDYNGRRVKTGVYLVFSSNSDGTETYVSKIAVI